MDYTALVMVSAVAIAILMIFIKINRTPNNN